MVVTVPHGATPQVSGSATFPIDQRDRYGYILRMKKHPLKAYRDENSMTRAALSRLLNVSKTTIARWEEGLRKIDEDQVPRIASITGIPAKELRPDLVDRLKQLIGAR